jgi:hypothetical protein
MALGVERHPGLRITRVAEAFEHLHRFADGVPDTVEDRAGFLARMTDRTLQVVHDRKPRPGHP